MAGSDAEQSDSSLLGLYYTLPELLAMVGEFGIRYTVSHVPCSWIDPGLACLDATARQEWRECFRNLCSCTELTSNPTSKRLEFQLSHLAQVLHV
jgi:hypothetical protein